MGLRDRLILTKHANVRSANIDSVRLDMRIGERLILRGCVYTCESERDWFSHASH
jgi:hypothetical protein